MNERALFEAALEISDPAARQAYLDQACAGNPELRARLAALLQSHADAGEFLSAAAVQPMPAKDTALEGGDAPASGSAEYEKTHGYTHDAAKEDDEISLGFLSPSTKPGSLGRLGHYEVHEVLGHGAFGIVLKAFDEKLHRMVAIKVMSPELAATSPPRKRFYREARSSATIRHENVVAIYAVEETPIPYLVMEYIPGLTLDRALNEHGPLDVADVLRIGQQIASGLAAAHSQGLIHRDIKPANILLENGLSGRVKISDFGLARAADDASLTQSGTIAGTPMYMSPEQATSGVIDQRSDLFSLGSVLYVLVSGRPPFRAANTLAVLKRVVDDTPRPIPEIIADTPQWLCAIIAKLQAKKPGDRFATANEVADLLGRCLADLQANRPVTLPAGMEIAEEKSVAAAEPVNPLSASDDLHPPTPALPHPRTSSSRRWPTIAALALIALIGLGVTEATGVTKLTSTVIRLTTGSGTLVIETDDPGVKVTIDGEEVSIQGAGVEQLTLKPGKYQIATVKDGQPVAQQLVTITRGGKEVVRVTMEGIAVSTPVSRDPQGSAISSDDPDRRAAEWVLSVGGTIDIHVNGIDRNNIRGGVLPEDAFKITGVGLNQNQKASDAGLALLKDCTDLTLLEMPITKVSDVGLAHFRNRKNLKHIRLAAMPNISNAGLANFARCKDLEFLELDSNPQISDEGLAHFQGVKNLHTLYLKVVDVSDKGLEYFKDCNKLITLAVVSSKVTDVGLAQFEDLSTLTYLELGGTRISDAGLVLVKKCTGLVALGLNSTQVTDLGLEHLVGFTELKTVRLKTTKVTEAGVKKLATALPKCHIEWDGGVIEPRESGDGWHGWPADAPKPAIAPFDAAQAKKHQEEWAAYLKVPVEYTNSIGMKFRLIPPGEFLMGSTEEEVASLEGDPAKLKSEAPRHKVILTKPFFLGVHEVTQGNYQKVRGNNPSHFSQTGDGKAAVADRDTSTHPVERVNWNDCSDFCITLSQFEEQKPAYFRQEEKVVSLNDTGYRLPTEAEWEYACRAGIITQRWMGDDNDQLIRAAWFKLNSKDRTHAIGELEANPFGLYDILGNVAECVQSGFDWESYSRFAAESAIDPDLPFTKHKLRVVRGGTWDAPLRVCRASWRDAGELTSDTDRIWDIGFRVALSVDAVKQALKAKPVKPAEPPATSDAAKPQPAELVLPQLKGQPFPTRTAATWEPGPKENVIAGLIPRPAKLDGVVRWQIDSIAPRANVEPVAMSPDRKYVACALKTLVTAAWPCTVRVYDTETGELAHLFPHPAGVGSISWHKDSRQVATGSADGRVRVWSLDGRKTAEWPAHKDRVYVAWSPNGKWIATRTESEDRVARLWDAEGQAVAELAGPALRITALAWSPDSQWLAVGDDKARVQLWKSDGTRGREFQTDWVNVLGIAWHPDSQRLAFAGDNGLGVEHGAFWIAGLNGDSPQVVRLKNSRGMWNVCWSPDGNVIGANSYDQCGFWNSDGTPVATLKNSDGMANTGGNFPIGKLLWSPDSQYVVTNRGSLFQADGTAKDKLWALDGSAVAGWNSDGRQLLGIHQTLSLFRVNLDGTSTLDDKPTPWFQPFVAADWHPRSPAFVAGSAGAFGWWTLDGRRQPIHSSFDGNLGRTNVTGLSCSPDGVRTLHIDEGRVWGLRGARYAFYRDIPGCQGDKISWSPDGRKFIARGQYAARIISLDAAETILLSPETYGDILDVAWSPNGQHIAVATTAEKVHLADQTGISRQMFEFANRVMGVNWFPDSQQFVVSFLEGELAAQIYDIDGTPGLGLRSSFSTGSRRGDLSHDGRHFTAASHDSHSYDTHLVTWDPAEASIAWAVPKYALHASEFRKIEWHADGVHLLTQSRDGTFGVWNGENGELKWLVTCPTHQDNFSFDAAGQLLFGDPTKLDAWFRCVIEDADGKLTTLKPSEFARRFPEFITPDSWPALGQPSDPERKAAARLLEMGCSLGIYVGGLGRVIKSADELPRERFAIATISGRLTDGDLVWLHKNRQTFEDLYYLHLTAGNNTDKAIGLLKDFPNLWWLEIPSSGKLDTGIEIPQVTCLHLSGPQAASAVPHLRALPELMELHLQGESITDELIDPLSQLNTLGLLHLSRTKITADGLSRLKAALPLCVVNGS